MQIQAFDFSLDLMRAILWQYNDAERLQSIIGQKEDWYRAHYTAFWNDWYWDVFRLDTANDFGLSVWGIILGQSRDACISGALADYPAFGFAGRRNFGRGNFRRAKAGFLRLGAEPFRLLLQLRYFKLISRGTVPEINAFLERMFKGQGKAYVLDGLDMTLTYVFTFVPEAWQRFVLLDMDALPRPAGVGTKIRIVTRKTWGFGKHHRNFLQGTFADSKQQ